MMTTAMTNTATEILSVFRATRYNAVGIREDGSLYPCDWKDIPRGAIDRYVTMDDYAAAVTAIEASIEAGWNPMPALSWDEQTAQAILQQMKGAWLAGRSVDDVVRTFIKSGIPERKLRGLEIIAIREAVAEMAMPV
jgi:hypothetical protein